MASPVPTSSNHAAIPAMTQCSAPVAGKVPLDGTPPGVGVVGLTPGAEGGTGAVPMLTVGGSVVVVVVSSGTVVLGHVVSGGVVVGGMVVSGGRVVTGGSVVVVVSGGAVVVVVVVVTTGGFVHFITQEMSLPSGADAWNAPTCSRLGYTRTFCPALMIAASYWAGIHPPWPSYLVHCQGDQYEVWFIGCDQVWS